MKKGGQHWTQQSTIAIHVAKQHVVEETRHVAKEKRAGKNCDTRGQRSFYSRSPQRVGANLHWSGRDSWARRERDHLHQSPSPPPHSLHCHYSQSTLHMHSTCHIVTIGARGYYCHTQISGVDDVIYSVVIVESKLV